MLALTSAKSVVMEEPETRQTSRSECTHRPASSQSQDISQVLASTFKDLYTKSIIGRDTLSNLTKTKEERGSYHDRYVKELQQAHAEYSHCVQQADMLESHIIQARAKAASKESEAFERLKEDIGLDNDNPGVPIVKSAFPWYIDDDLLKVNNLISPQDYLPHQNTQLKAKAEVKLTPPRSPLGCTTHLSREPQDDGYSLKSVPDKNESDLSLTFESSSCSSERKTTANEKQKTTKHRPKIKDVPGRKDFDKLKQENKKQCTLNPRFLPPNAHKGGKSLIHPICPKSIQCGKGIEKQSPYDDPIPVFVATPSVVYFTDYNVGRVYEVTLELKNLTSSCRNVRVFPPRTTYFSIGLGRFPGEGGVVAPGMSCKYTVLFAPDSLADYEDFIVVETQAEHALVVPIEARRPPPVLTLPRVLDCGYCLIGGVKLIQFQCQNVGLSTGTFCIVPKSQWPASNLRSVVRTFFMEQAPFAVSPSLFVLQPGDTTVVEVVFFPVTSGKCCQVFTVVCDNCQVKDISTEGEGQLIALELVSVSGEELPPMIGEARDLTADHFVRFSPCNSMSVQERKVVIRNNVNLDLPFHWQIMRPNLNSLLPGEVPVVSHIQFQPAKDDAFQVSPSTGILAPCKDQEFLFSFCPKEVKDYHSVCHLVLRDIPQPPVEPFDNRWEGKCGILQPVHPGSKLSDVIVMEIEVKGSTINYQILLEPYAIVIPGEVFIFTTIQRQFKMWNHSRTSVTFEWEKISSSHRIEVEPSAGKIEMNECLDFNLTLSGGKPERVVTSLVCHIQHDHETVALAVEVSFKGPTVTLSVPSVDFGLIRPGEQKHRTLLLTNITKLKAPWILKQVHNNQQGDQNCQIFVEPCSGVLLPFSSWNVDVFFRPLFCQQFETELELKVENGTGCHLSLRADVQSPQVCLLNCELVLSEVYFGVPTKRTVTLFNQTLHPANFTWMTQLQGQKAPLCSASFDPPSGTLGPNANMDITVNFTSHTDLETTEVAALCEVEGMKLPLVLAIAASKAKQLSIYYSLPGVRYPPDDQNPSVSVLDFGNDVLFSKPVVRHLQITNQTAIPASFTIEVEYFTCHTQTPDSLSKKGIKMQLNPIQEKKLDEKIYKEFVSNLLAHSKGVAFAVSPSSGILGAFETLTVTLTAYNDMWGEYKDNLICKVGNLEPTIIPMEMTVKGCPLYFQLIGPNLDDPNQGPATQFGTHVSGGDTVSRSLRINNPTIFDIRMDWEAYNVDRDDSKLVDLLVSYGEAFPIKDADGNEMLSGAVRRPNLRIQTDYQMTHFSGSEASDASQQSSTELVNEEPVDEDGKTCLYPYHGKKKFLSVHIRPHRGNLSNYPYCITPQQIVVPAKGSATIHISFTPLSLSGSAGEVACFGVALGFMSLDYEVAACVPGKVRRFQGLDVEPLRIDLLGVVKPATLLVQTEEDTGVLDFHASVSDLLKTEMEEVLVQDYDVIQSIQLRNNCEMPLHFRLQAQPPFSVQKSQPRGQTRTSSKLSSKDSQCLVLKPKHNMQVAVAFHCSLSLLNYAELAGEEAKHGVTLVQSANGQKTLRFQQNLLIHFSNNNTQEIPLQAHLKLATLFLSSDIINFGVCYVNQTQTIEVNLCSDGGPIYWKSVIEASERDLNVFRVTPDCGMLRTKDLNVTVCSKCLQISFTACDARDFKAKVMIHSPLMKTPIALQLRGTGSFNATLRSDQTQS